MVIAVASTREDLAVRYSERGTHASLHTDDPGTTGTNEISGGSPSYARPQLDWATGSIDGVVTASVDFNVPPGVTLRYLVLWSALTGGTIVDKVLLPETAFPNQGIYRITLTYTQS